MMFPTLFLTVKVMRLRCLIFHLTVSCFQIINNLKCSPKGFGFCHKASKHSPKVIKSVMTQRGCWCLDSFISA